MSGSDRGGIGQIIQLIKNTLIPIIWIWNDRKNIKIQSLANYWYDWKFTPPTKQQILIRLTSILKN